MQSSRHWACRHAPTLDHQAKASRHASAATSRPRAANRGSIAAFRGSEPVPGGRTKHGRGAGEIRTRERGTPVTRLPLPFNSSLTEPCFWKCRSLRSGNAATYFWSYGSTIVRRVELRAGMALLAPGQWGLRGVPGHQPLSPEGGVPRNLRPSSRSGSSVRPRPSWPACLRGNATIRSHLWTQRNTEGQDQPRGLHPCMSFRLNPGANGCTLPARR